MLQCLLQLKYITTDLNDTINKGSISNKNHNCQLSTTYLFGISSLRLTLERNENCLYIYKLHLECRIIPNYMDKCWPGSFHRPQTSWSRSNECFDLYNVPLGGWSDCEKFLQTCICCSTLSKTNKKVIWIA